MSAAPPAETSDRTALSSDHATKPAFAIGFPPDSVAADEVLITHITDLVNTVYTEAEKGIFNDNYVRTTPEEVRGLLASQQLALAARASTAAAAWSPASRIQGCVRIIKRSPTRGEFGMLVAGPETRGSGLGRQLVDFAEQHCRAWGASCMEAQLLVPTTFKHPLKSWVQPWYERLGYQVVTTEDFGLTYPRLAPLVKTPVEYRIFEKPL